MKTELSLSLLNIGYAEPNELWNWEKVYSPFARIYYVVKGEAHIIINHHVHELSPGRLYLIPPFTLHSNRCEGLFHHYYIHFYENGLPRESVFDTYIFPIEIRASSLGLNLVKKLLLLNPERYLHNIDPRQYDNQPTISRYMADSAKLPLYAQIATKGILLQLISGFLEQAIIKDSDKDKRIVRTLLYIHENIDKELTISELAAIACVSEDHFIRLFKLNVDQTPLQYINLKRIESIQLQLVSTDTPIREIAHRVSIDNISYFNRLFKQHAGLTPTEYRKAYRDADI